MTTQSRYQAAIKAVASEGSQRKAAELLGIGRTTLARIIRQRPGHAAALSAARRPGEIELTDDIVAAFEAVKSGNIGICEAARSLDMNQSTFSRKYARWNPKAREDEPQQRAVVKPTSRGSASPTRGLAGFKALFSPAQRGHDALAKLIDGPLKERGWIYDAEMRELAKVDSISWTNLRRDYEHLLVEVRDPETRTRRTVWCHPEIVEEARAVAKERSR